jgi:hypothetical protein
MNRKITAHFSSLLTAKAESVSVKYLEIIADNLSKAGWSWGCVEDELRHLTAVIRA